MEERLSVNFVRVLLTSSVPIYFFDEHGRELLTALATIDAPLRARIRLEHASLPYLTREQIMTLHDASEKWFGLRVVEDDRDAITLTLRDAVAISDVHADERLLSVNGLAAGADVISTSIIRDENGNYQELDIIRLLQRVFAPAQIYHNPKRTYDQEEIADIVVLTDRICLMIQAKDSPTTEASASQSIDRKRRKSIKHLKKAMRQASGAINYIDRMHSLPMLVGDSLVEIDLGKRWILSLAVLREMFDDFQWEYSVELMRFHSNTELPCIALDYSSLIDFVSFCPDEVSFVGAYFEVFDFGMNNGTFPRLRFGKNRAVGEP